MIPIIIPAYEPDNRLLELLKSLRGYEDPIIIVDDGSGAKYSKLFNKAQTVMGENGVILSHDVNKGKGRALKTAFQYVLNNIPQAIGTITADSDGQHTYEAIVSVRKAFIENQESLVLGSRCFEGTDIPWKSRFGNRLTLSVMRLTNGITVSDTQTGLRAIPRPFMKELLDVDGERFEFETRMLLACRGKYHIIEVPIDTIYESKTNHQTHFRPVRDSFMIYRIIFGDFIKYVISAFSSFVIDIVLFSVLCIFLKPLYSVMYVTISSILARIVSATYNYFINYVWVFKSKAKRVVAASKYAVLAIIVGLCSSFVTTLLVWLTGGNETVLKIIVDVLLFFINYRIQKKYVF